MASRSLNKVVLLGNLTRDPELKYTPAGTAVCTFGLATNRSWTTSDGSTKEEAQYHRIVAWQKLAELCSKLLTKGKKVYVEGRITYREYTTKEGLQKSITEIVMDDFIVFYETRKDDAGAYDSESSSTQASQQATQADDTPSEPPQKSQASGDIDPDDIPF